MMSDGYKMFVAVMLSKRQFAAAYSEAGKQKVPYEAKWAGSQERKEAYRKEQYLSVL